MGQSKKQEIKLHLVQAIDHDFTANGVLLMPFSSRSKFHNNASTFIDSLISASACGQNGVSVYHPNFPGYTDSVHLGYSGV